MFKKTREGGFTLIELMIVVAIIGILAAVAIPRFADLVSRAQEAATKGSLSSVRSAVTIYYGGTGGEMPDQLSDLVDEYIRQIPGGNIPQAAGGTGITWEVGDWYARNETTDGLVDATYTDGDGWAYDNTSMHVWIPDDTLDTSDEPYHTW